MPSLLWLFFQARVAMLELALSAAVKYPKSSHTDLRLPLRSLQITYLYDISAAALSHSQQKVIGGIPKTTRDPAGCAHLQP